MLTKQQLELLLAMMEQSSFPGKILRLALETQAELQRQLLALPSDGRAELIKQSVADVIGAKQDC